MPSDRIIRSAPSGRQLRQALAWRFRREAERLRQVLLLQLFGCTPRLRYLATGLASRSLARLTRPGRHRVGLPLGNELREQGFARLTGRLDSEVIAAIREEFATGLEDPSAVKDLMREAEDGSRHVARRSLIAPWRRLPSLSRLLDETLETELADYFGSDFYVAMVEAYRTYGIPGSSKNAFGKFMTWHIDTQQHIDVIKLFVPLDRVASDQGPTEVLDKASSRALSRWLARRLDHVHDAEIERLIEEGGSGEALTAAPGDGYLIETQYCFHRAGIPEPGRTRDLLVIRLRPWSRAIAPGALAKGRVGRLRT